MDLFVMFVRTVLEQNISKKLLRPTENISCVTYQIHNGSAFWLNHISKVIVTQIHIALKQFVKELVQKAESE